MGVVGRDVVDMLSSCFETGVVERESKRNPESSVEFDNAWSLRFGTCVHFNSASDKPLGVDIGILLCFVWCLRWCRFPSSAV